MKEEKKKTESENKIVAFDIDENIMTDENIDRFLKESLIQEADELEAELNRNPGLSDADVSDNMFESIVSQLKEQGIWEEEEESKAGEEKITKNAEATESVEEKGRGTETETEKQQEQGTHEKLEKLYAMLPEEDRQALELGKEIARQKERRAAKKWKRRRILKRSVIVAAMLVLVFSASMTIDANRRLVLKAWDGVMYNLGFRVSTDYTDAEVDVESRTKEEVAAMRDISETLGVSAISFEYLPEGMEYLSYEIMDDNSEAVIFYAYQEKIFNITIINLKIEGVLYYALDNESVLREIVKNEQKLKMNIMETNIDLEEETYTIEFDYNDARYILNGMISLEEMKKIAKNIIIY